MISRETIDRIFQTAQIEDVVSDYVQLKRSGANLKGLCPFHAEKTPSFIVSPTKNLCKCFGCGKGGTPVSFIMEYEQLSYPEALRRLAQRYNIPIEETGKRELTNEERKEKQRKESLRIANAFAADFFVTQLRNTDAGKNIALSYLKQRGLRDKVIEAFELGYAPKGPTALLDTALQQGYQQELLRDLGLLNKRGQDFFKQRLMFPIHDKSGKVIAFAGRVLGSGNHGKAPKYINSPETDIYHKSEVLYGLYQARAAIRREKNVILVEGYTDVLSLHQAGIEHVVASSGTALTVQQILLVRRLTENITILYDGDAAGVQAAMRGLNIALENGMNVHIALLPDGADPDSYVQAEGGSGMRKYLEENRLDFIRFQIQLLLTENQSAADKAAAIELIIESLSYIPDGIKRAMYIQEAAKSFGLTEKMVNDRANKHILQRKRREQNREIQQARRDHQAPYEQEPPPAEAFSAAIAQPLAHIESEIARILICYGSRSYNDQQSIAEFVLETIREVADEFDDMTMGKIVHESIHALDNGESLTESFFTNHTDHTIRQKAVDFLQSPYLYSENWEKRFRIQLQTQPMPDDNYRMDAERVLLFFQEEKFQQMRNQIVQHLQKLEKQPKDTSQQQLVYMKALMEISHKIQTLSKRRETWRM